MPPTDLNLETVLSVLELLPTPAMLVDTSYGVRARNRAMDKLLDSRRPGQVTDSVGDLLRCMHARKGGCGSHKSCGACRLIKAVTTAA